MLSPFRKEVKLMILNRLSTLGIITFGMLSFAANSAQPDIKFASKEYGVTIGESRIIYPLDAAGVMVSVKTPKIIRFSFSLGSTTRIKKKNQRILSWSLRHCFDWMLSNKILCV